MTAASPLQSTFVPSAAPPAGMPHAEPFSSQREIERLRERARLLEGVVDNFPGGILVFDKDLNMVFCNERQKQLLGYSESLFSSGYPSLEEIFRFNAERGEYGSGDVEEHVKLRMDLAQQKTAHVFERTRPNGTVLEVRGVPLKGGGFVTTYLDVTEQRRTQALIAHMAHHDALTDLPNRALFQDRLEQAVARVRRGATIALLFIDLDHFKPINDVHGHAVGDGLLQAVAGRLNSAKRETDTAARLGGDEFVLIQTAIGDDDDVLTFANRLIDTISKPYVILGIEVTIGASIGIAVAPRHGTEPDELLRKADAALYRCKANGRAGFQVFD